MERRSLRGISYQKDGKWFAVLLDHYLMTYADTEEELAPRILDMLLTHVVACLETGQTPFEGVHPAPERFWDMYNRVRELHVEEITPPQGLFAGAFPQVVELSRAQYCYA